MVNLRSAIENTVPITLFNRGQAGKIFEDVRREGPKVVIKNNVAECVLLSPEDYVKLIDELEDAKLLALANERMAHYDPSKTIPAEEVYKELGITDEDLDDIDVEIE
ncbi:MAG: type II toxin-antitoxin system Phd/YefM family antitoxin [Oscillospiraceae bacterium]|nr:type II toxin-antitoxin system Phd/YefM family antitoxin [Oscillospiraceae bacterium]